MSVLDHVLGKFKDVLTDARDVLEEQSRLLIRNVANQVKPKIASIVMGSALAAGGLIFLCIGCAKLLETVLQTDGMGYAFVGMIMVVIGYLLFFRRE